MSAIGVRQAVLATAGEGMWNAGAFYAELDPFTLVLALENTGATLRNPHADPVAAVVIAPHGPFAPFPAGLPRMHERMDTIVSDAGHAWRPRVEAALRAVPRHMFVPEADPEDTCRAHTAVVTKRSCATSTRRPHRRSWRSCGTCDTRSHVLRELTDGDRVTS
jgi:transposase